MLLMTSPELWALARRTSLELRDSLVNLDVRDRGEEFDEVALLGLVCRGPAAADITETIVLHPMTAEVFAQLTSASGGFNTLSIGAQQLGSTRYLSTKDGFVSIEKGANDVYGFQLVRAEAPLPSFIAGNIIASMSMDGSELSDVVVRRTSATDGGPVAGLRRAPDGSLVVEPAGKSYSSLDETAAALATAIGEL